MYNRMGVEELITAVKNRVEEKTGIQCYDLEKEENTKPFYVAEILKSVSKNTKTMFREIFTIQIQCVPKTTDSTKEIYSMIQHLQEAMTETISLPEPWNMISQTDKGIQSMKKEKTEELKPVLQYEFTVCYAVTCKQ